MEILWTTQYKDIKPEGFGEPRMESSVGAYQAKTHLPQLLDRVEGGETITITRHGKPVAKLIPAAVDRPKPDVRKVIEEMKRFQAEHGPTLGPDLTIRNLIEEGRRF
jgi:prevent-host-death family protein